jgi:hypothetical protein
MKKTWGVGTEETVADTAGGQPCHGGYGTPPTNARIVIAGLKGKPVAARCPAQPIRQAHDSYGRKQVLAPAPQACEVPEQRHREARLAREQARWKPLGADAP